ncbi:MAG: acyltransferase domain-containing protein [Candidatus Heimdallarchaeota archaeon]
MVSRYDFENIISKHKPILAYNPQGISDVTLIKSVVESGGIGLVDLERLQDDTIQELLQNCSQNINDSWGIRISSKEQLKLVLTQHEDSFPLILVIGDFKLTSTDLQKIKAKSIVLLAEVISLEEAYDKKWAEVFIVKGNEAAGRVGDQTSFILAQQFADAGLPFIVQGGIGLYTTPAVFAVGAKAIVLDTQLFLTPESPLSNQVKEFLSKLDATDTKVLGESTSKKYRVYARLGTKIVREIVQKEKELLELTKKERTKVFQEILLSKRDMFDKDDISNCLIPIGQDIPFAGILTAKFKDVNGIINGLLKQAKKQIKEAIMNYPFRENTEIAKTLGVKYPLIQGPMANVSESPKFAKVTSNAGALPFLALGSLFPNQTRTLISETKKALGEKPFGCGLIGLEANKTARDEHLKIIKELKPPFVVVAAGTIDQAKEIMNYDIETFLHTPSPLIFAEAIESNVYSLILEGMECGGHIGVLTSFVLWELSLHQLAKLEDSIKNSNKKVTVAFAGGIGDRFSAAIAGVVSSSLPELMNGVMWVGSAYILVKEIVETGAIQPLYQQLALNAKETMVMGETVNTRARSIPTPFAREIIKRELDRIHEGISLKERKHQYERDNLGATRVAALGEIWNPDGEDDKPNRFMFVDEKVQHKKGNYLIGQIVTSLRCIRSIDNLHDELIMNSQKVVTKKGMELAEKLRQISEQVLKIPEKKIDPVSTDISYQEVNTDIFESEGIAVIGLGCVFPDAPNIKTYWKNILKKVYSIKEISKKRWHGDINLFYSEDRNMPNKTYAKIAAEIEDLKFNSIEFKIPPKVTITMGKTQKLALMAAKEALTDSGLLEKGVDNNRTAVIIGNSMGDEIRGDRTRKIYVPEFLASIEKTSSFKDIDKKSWENIRKEVFDDYESKLSPINEDAMPGELSNIIAGRIANVFNLRGKSMTTDAACASSLAALNVAVKGLLDKEYNVALCGGVDCSLDPTTFVKFAKIGAISAEGSFPFDARANGFVMGEGAGFCVLKRLSEAVKDGNKIYAVFRGFGAASDGKGKGITAPNPIGQKLAIERALDQAGLTFSDIQYVEAHGTSTTVGDVIEMQVLNEMAQDIKPASIAIGSIKSQIGHLKSAGGIASIIKTALALHHKILPPSINFKTPNPKIDWATSPFYVNINKQDWKLPSTGFRAAGISSFGFGGTNYHAIIEEYIPGKTRGHLPTLISSKELQNILAGAHIAQGLSTSAEFEKVLDTSKWQDYIGKNISLEIEPIFFGGNSEQELIDSINDYKGAIPKSTFKTDGTGFRVRNLTVQSLDNLSKKIKASITCSSLEDLPKTLDTLVEGIKEKRKRKLLMNKGMFFSDDHSLGKIAFLFPGQGSQYLRMGKELFEKYTIVQETFNEADEITKELIGFPISDVIFTNGKSDEEAVAQLKETEITQPAIFTLNIAIFRLLKSFGIEPDFVAGHSMGEYAALVASGILSLRDGFLAIVPRGQTMSKFKSKDKGTMASIGAGYEVVDEVLKTIDEYVIAANKNSPKQTVISGSTVGVKAAIKAFTDKGIPAIPLPVSAAFHSKIVEIAVVEFRKALKKLKYKKPLILISSNVTGELYPTTRKEIIDLLCAQVCSPVEWIKQITDMYEKHGARTFIEIGPKYVLTSFNRGILEEKTDVLSLASNHPKRGAIQHFSEVIGALGTYCYPIKYPALESTIYTPEFRNPLERFYTKRVISRESVRQTIVKKSPFDILINSKLKSLVKEDSFSDYLKLQAPAISAFLEVGYETYKTTIAEAMKEKERFDKLQINTEAIGITGVSIGLPGRDRKVFDESNFDAILAGENFIDLIPMEYRKKMVDKNIVRLVKDAIKGAQFQTISDVSEVIKLAAQKGQFNLSEEYGVDVGFTEILDITFQLAFAAGIEAMRDAGIPLMPLKVKTSVGKEITKGWALPESLRNETGIIFASAFPAYSNLISVVSEYLADKYANKNREEINLLFDELIDQISNKTSKERIQQWFLNNKSQIATDKESQFQFSRKFLFEILSMGHSQFAQFIRARGPNTQVNAACSSTTQAVAIAEDWIRTSRCKRVIVIAADDVTNEVMLEWIGSGFLAVGAATTLEKVEEAALPFDKRRHGMIIGMGAVGIVIEAESAIQKRGVKPIVDLLGTHIVNSAFHGTRLDRDHISSQVDEFITNIERRHGITREEIARELVFVSHETYTPARGGSASAEVDALRKTFGSMIDKIVIANTKGFTGHAMGAGIEDVVAVKILEKGIVPPVANWKELDPELGHLNLSKGGKYNVKYALRFAAGFGSQLTLVLYRLNTSQNRLEGVGYEQWLNSLGGTKSTMEVVKKTLRLKEDPTLIKPQQIIPKITAQTGSMQDEGIVKAVVDLISEKTGYPIDMIEPNMHLEEDLGIDTVKQAELFGVIRTKYSLPREEGVRIQEYFSVNKIAEYITSRISGEIQPSSVDSGVQIQQGTSSSHKEIAKEITLLISEKTGYPTDMIEADMELEEDLGIDTVKQAEMFGIIRTKWNLPREEGIRIQEYSTVNKIAEYILKRVSDASQTSTEVVAETTTSTEDIYVPAKRLVLQLIESPMPKAEKIKLKDKKFIIAGETGPFTTKLISLLGDKKANLIKHLDLKTLNSREKILKEIPEDVIDGLIYIEPKTSQKNKHNLTARIFFTLCRDINYSDSPLVLTISQNITSFGWNGKHKPISGSLTGLTKAIAREFTNSRVKCVACNDPKYAIDEICAGDGSIEVSYTEDGKRKVFVTVETPVEVTDQPFTISKDELVIITGGALGITYQISKELAKRYQPKLALVGIETLPDNIDEIANYSEERLAQLKDQLISDLKQREERVTPVLIEKEWSKISKAIDVKKGIEELTALGSVVKYYSTNVVNTEQMKSTIEQIGADFGQEIIGIIHGAGLEISRLIKDKKPEEFDLVYNVKAIGLDNLIQNINMKKVKFVKCFSSVAGRYGNGGQVDYSAANDYLSKNCWQLRSKGIRATSICWSAWGEVGMATRGSIMTVLKYAGVTPITVNDGVAAFINELEYGLEPEVVIAGKLGVLMESPSAFIQVDKNFYPLIGKIKRNFDGSIVSVRNFTLDNDLYLNHHRFDNIPYLPAVIGLEIFAELAKIAFPKSKLAGFNDVEFKSAIKFTNDKSRILKARLNYSTKNPECTIFSEFVKDGVTIGKPNTHFKAKIILGQTKEEIVKKPKLQKGSLANKKNIYDILPHGPLFQVLKDINDVSQEIIAKTSIPVKNHFNFENIGFTSIPLTLEAAFQAMGILDIVKHEKLGLPFGIKSLTFNKTDEPPAFVLGSKIDETDFGSLYDFKVISQSGKSLLKVEGYATVQVDFGAELVGTQTIQLNRVKRLFDITKGAHLEVISVNQIKENLKDTDFIDKNLHPEEKEKLASIKVEKKRDEWFAGLIAIKQALQKMDPNLNPNAIKISKTELGKPFIQLDKKKSPIHLSITHSNGFAVGIVDPTSNTGIDLEIKEKRDDSFVKELIGPQEQELLKNEQMDITEELLTKIWTAKEAASKVLGVGLNIDLHDLIISNIKDQEITLQIDPVKIPEEGKKYLDKKLIRKSNLELIAKIAQNEEFVASICQINSK